MHRFASRYKIFSMLYSYRHPDLVERESKTPKLSEHEVASLVERRRFVRSIPIPAAIESTDAEVWSLWDKAAGSEQTAEE
jgi:hypothetical protein